MKNALLIASIALILVSCGNPISKKERAVVCTDPPKPTEIGRDIYPIAKKYERLEFLGQLFTAHACGEERLKKIFGVEGDTYTLGSTLFLENEPSQKLEKTLRDIGFSCVENKEKCRQWGLNETVEIEALMKLEPFVENFRDDDCRNCG